MKPSVVNFTPCSFAGSLKTLPKSKKLSREWNLLGRRMSLQQMYSGEWMGMPSAYWPGLSWGTRPTQLSVTGWRGGVSSLPFFSLLGAVFDESRHGRSYERIRSSQKYREEGIIYRGL